jgi:Peptidase family M1 domain
MGLCRVIKKGGPPFRWVPVKFVDFGFNNNGRADESVCRPHPISSALLWALIILSLAAGATKAANNYWQQEVNYVMNVTLQPDRRTIDGSIDIEYINNSPDTLRVLYLKAFPNAVQKDSYSAKRLRAHVDYDYHSLTPESGGSLTLKDKPGAKHNYESFTVDNTIITLNLSQPLVPHDTIPLSFDYTTILPSPGKTRMGIAGDRGEVTKGVYWYPQVCVYDHKLGWVNSQYIDWGECYGDYGKFDVHITAPENEIIAATGVLENSNVAMPDSLRELLDIKNFFGSKATWPKFAFDSSRTKTWHFVAEQVNDFAFVASPEFCLDSDTVNGTEIAIYALRGKAAGWKDAVRLSREALETFSELVYPYKWPVLRVTDSYDGMEYPMLASCGGKGPSPSFSYLLYHEIGHQWFMGMIGTNSPDRPFLDEGFTTHIEHVAMEKYYGREGNFDNFTKWYQKLVAPHIEDRDERGYRPLMLTITNELDQPMLFSYDQGEEYLPYRYSAYYKCAAMHYSLRSILGDSLYFKALRHYCNNWAFKHPYEDEFIQSFEEATGLELDAYLDQWLYGRKKLDYDFAGISTKNTPEGFEHTIRLKQPGTMVAPIDVAVIWEQGDTTLYTVPPEGMEYAKPNAVLMPTWYQFRRPEEKYSFTVKAKRKIDRVVIDPYCLLPDVNRLNNTSGLMPPIEVRLDNMKYDRAPVNAMAVRVRPDVWYTRPDGLQLGFHSHGSYLQRNNNYSLDIRMGTESGDPAIDFTVRRPERFLGPKFDNFGRILMSDQRLLFETGTEVNSRKYISRPDTDRLRVTFGILRTEGNELFRSSSSSSALHEVTPYDDWDENDVLYGSAAWSATRSSYCGIVSASTKATYGGQTEEYQYQAFFINVTNLNFDLHSGPRSILRASLNSIDGVGAPPTQFLYHLSRGQAVEKFSRSKLFRTRGTVADELLDEFYPAIGLVRGYQDRQIYFTDAISASMTVIPPDALPFRWFKTVPLVGGFLSQIDNELFMDWARVSADVDNNEYRFSFVEGGLAFEYGNTDFIAAGVSLTMPPVWSNHRVRVDFPIYLNKPISGDKQTDFRVSVAWLLPVD